MTLIVNITPKNETEPTIHLANYDIDITHQGQVYSKSSFQIDFPKQKSKEKINTSFVIDNTGRDLTDIMLSTNGLTGAKFELIEIDPEQHNIRKKAISLYVEAARMNGDSISGSLTINTIYNQTGILISFTPNQTPLLF